MSYKVDARCDEDLAIDVAILGEEGAPTVITSSGVHGVEGFMGSAIQLAVLKQMARANREEKIRHVFIHAVNPYGFSQLRRFNEDNVDLNRNFLEKASDFKGAPEGYKILNGFLNPESPPSRFEPFKLKTIWNICRYGFQNLKQSVAGGQYEFPRGIFYGGSEPSQSARIVSENCDEWIGTSQRIVHVDFHTGLGAFGKYKMLLNEYTDSQEYRWHEKVFGGDLVEGIKRNVKQPIAFEASGIFNDCLKRHFKGRECRSACAEFGTYGVIRVLGAIRAENRAHHYGDKDSKAYQDSKKELLECFCPKSESWRQEVIKSGLDIIKQSESALRSKE